MKLEHSYPPFYRNYAPHLASVSITGIGTIPFFFKDLCHTLLLLTSIRLLCMAITYGLPIFSRTIWFSITNIFSSSIPLTIYSRCQKYYCQVVIIWIDHKPSLSFCYEAGQLLKDIGKTTYLNKPKPPPNYKATEDYGGRIHNSSIFMMILRITVL